MSNNGLPYDGWYNGNGDLMIANGTFDDFRPHLVEKVKINKLRPEKLKAWDETWSKVPVEEKLRRRAVVVEDNTPKKVEFLTKSGKVTVYRSKPSDNNNLDPDRNRKNGHKRFIRPRGALTNENNPLLKKE